MSGSSGPSAGALFDQSRSDSVMVAVGMSPRNNGREGARRGATPEPNSQSSPSSVAPRRLVIALSPVDPSERGLILTLPPGARPSGRFSVGTAWTKPLACGLANSEAA